MLHVSLSDAIKRSDDRATWRAAAGDCRRGAADARCHDLSGGIDDVRMWDFVFDGALSGSPLKRLSTIDAW